MGPTIEQIMLGLSSVLDGTLQTAGKNNDYNEDDFATLVLELAEAEAAAEAGGGGGNGGADGIVSQTGACAGLKAVDIAAASGDFMEYDTLPPEDRELF